MNFSICYKEQNTVYSDFQYEFDRIDYKNGHSKCSIRPNTTLNIYRAFDYAKYIGSPLNTFITLKFFDNNESLGRVVFTKIRQAINRWLKRISDKRGNALTPTWVFVFENPNDHFHVHWFIYIPSDLKEIFQTKVKKLLAKHQKAPVESNQLDFQDVNPYTDKTLANYVCKGVRPDFISFFHLQERASFQGHIVGQRARVSKNLGPKAINKSGFEPRLQRQYWIKLHPEIAVGYEKPPEWSLDNVVPQLTGAKTFPGFRDYWVNNLRKDSAIGRLSRLCKENKIREGTLKNKLNEHIVGLKKTKKYLH